MASKSKNNHLILEKEDLNAQINLLQAENTLLKEKSVTMPSSSKSDDYPEHLKSFLLSAAATNERLDNEYLLRLLHTYDEKLKEKTQLIKSYEERLSYLELNPNKPKMDESISMDEWLQLKDQSRLVLEENQLLVEQKILYKKTLDGLTTDYQEEVTKLSQESIKHIQEKKTLESLLSESQLDNSQLRNRNKKLLSMLDECIDTDQHEEEVQKITREHINELNLVHKENEELKSKLEAVSGEKDRLAIQVTDHSAMISRLKLEIELTEKSYRKSEKRLVHSFKLLENVCGKEFSTKETLSEVIKVAEHNANERDHLMRLIVEEKGKTKGALDQLQFDDVKLTKLKNKLQKQKTISKEKVADVSVRLEHQNKEMALLKKKYETELDDLKDIVRQKQKFINRLQDTNRSTEDRMEKLWSSICANS